MDIVHPISFAFIVNHLYGHPPMFLRFRFDNSLQMPADRAVSESALTWSQVFSKTTQLKILLTGYRDSKRVGSFCCFPTV